MQKPFIYNTLDGAEIEIQYNDKGLAPGTNGQRLNTMGVWYRQVRLLYPQWQLAHMRSIVDARLTIQSNTLNDALKYLKG